MDVADVTGDGVLDIVTVSPNESVLRVFAGRGNGSFTAARTTGIGFDAYEVKATAGRDGVYGDVLVGRYYSLALVPGTVNGHLEGYRPVLEGDNFSDFAAADLNRDGRLDVCRRRHPSRTPYPARAIERRRRVRRDHNDSQRRLLDR